MKLESGYFYSKSSIKLLFPLVLLFSENSNYMEINDAYKGIQDTFLRVTKDKRVHCYNKQTSHMCNFWHEHGLTCTNGLEPYFVLLILPFLYSWLPFPYITKTNNETNNNIIWSLQEVLQLTQRVITRWRLTGIKGLLRGGKVF